MPQNRILDYNRSFKSIYVVDNRNGWINCASSFNLETDLVLCLDFGLKHELEGIGASVFFLDHLADSCILQEANYQMHKFLDNWYKDYFGNDMLVYKGLKLGDALLLDLITDVTSFCHFFFNAILIKQIRYEYLILAIDDKLVHNVFKKLNLTYSTFQTSNTNFNLPEYVFPISFWVKSKLYKKTFKQKIASILKTTLTYLHIIIDLISKHKFNIYIQDYHPTQPIISELLYSKSVVVRTTDFLLQRPILKQRRIPKKTFKKRILKADILLESFIESKKTNWNYDGHDLECYLYEIITSIIDTRINDACNTADCVIQHFNRNNYALVIPVTNYWLENRLIINYAKNKKVPVFMIANGILNMSFENDGRDSDYINCYSQAVKEDYFNNSENALCLGDPRMDKYYLAAQKEINRERPTIIIGAAGFNSIDLNSYLAYEFDFLYDILKALSSLKEDGRSFKIILKVRENGYEHQYKNFIEEYFDILNVDIIRDVAFHNLIQQADLYISLYSQTIFEASCFGIPVIYYKKDTQFINKPFNLESELVSACDVSALKEKILLFYNGSDVFGEFMKKPTLEKYIGPLDGKNTQRNLDFIENLIDAKLKHN